MSDATTDAAAVTGNWLHYTEPSFIDVGDVKVSYRRKGAGEPVVFLPTMGQHLRWLPFYEALATDFDVIVPELPGFGDTAFPEWLEDFTDLVLFCDALFDALGLDRVHLVGHGLGGWTASEFAVFYSKRLKSLTLLSPFGLRLPGHPLLDIFRLTSDEVPEALFSDPEGDYSPWLTYGDDAETLVRSLGDSFAAARLMWNPRYDYKLDTRLARVACPTLILQPDDDRIVPAEHFARWTELLPQARLEHVRGAGRPTGHGFIVQEPEVAAGALATFVKEVAS